MMSTAQGCYGESMFVSECLKRSIDIANPIVDVNGYDFLIISGSTHKKIQVKTTKQKDTRNPTKTYWKFNCKKGSKSTPYDETNFDFLAAFIIDLNCWYIIPISLLNKTTIRVNPDSLKCKYNQFKGAWHLLGLVRETSM